MTLVSQYDRIVNWGRDIKPQSQNLCHYQLMANVYPPSRIFFEKNVLHVKRRSDCCQMWHMDHMSMIDKKLGLVSMQTL